jgi:hypothetical protein
MAMELKIKNQRLAPQANCFPLLGAPKCRSSFVTLPPEPLQEQLAVVLLWGMPLASWLLALGERGGHGDLRGSGHLSVIPYVHRRTELYCSQACLASFLFSTPRKWRPPEPFITQGWVVYNEPPRPDMWPGVGEPYTVGHNG